jgi:hypothetical protein
MARLQELYVEKLVGGGNFKSEFDFGTSDSSALGTNSKI